MLAVLAAATSAVAAPAGISAPSVWWKGANIAPFGATTFANPAAANLYPDLRSEGGNAVLINIRLSMSNAAASAVGAGPDTPSDALLLAQLKAARAAGLRPGLKLLVDPADGAWSATIHPTDRSAWFAGYGSELNHYAALAAAGHASLLVVGTELDSMAQPADNGDWQRLIAAVRTRFHGLLSYAASQ